MGHQRHAGAALLRYFPRATQALILVVLVSGSVHGIMADTPCRDFVPWMEGACTVDSDGNRRGGCQRCLVGDEWDALRAEIGTASVVGHRKVHPKLAMNNWASQTIATSMFRILAEEMLGYDQSEVFTSAYNHVFDEVASQDCKAINVEVWHPVKESTNHSKIDDVIFQELGFIGVEGLYMPQYASFISAHHEALQQNVSQVLENGEIVYTNDLFPPDGSITPEMLSKWFPDSSEYDCTEENRKKGGWTSSTCVEGRWYPPQCGDTYPSANCKEIHMARLEWGRGILESMGKNAGLNFSFVYAGHEGIVDIVEEKFAKKENFVYFWWEPEPMHLRFPSREVVVPKGCGNEGARLDPGESDNKCGFENIPVEKRMHKDSALGEPDLQFLFDKWRITKPQIYKVLENHKSGGGGMNMEAAACQALKDELVDWKQWIYIHDRCLGQPGTIWSEEEMKCVGKEADHPSHLFTTILGAMLCIGLLLGGLALLLWRQHMLRLYVQELQDAAMTASGIEPMSFESPIMMAVEALQEVSSARFVSKKLRSSALKAWHLLLEQNPYAPAIDDVTVLDRAHSTTLNDNRKAARLVVGLYSRENDFTPAWLATNDSLPTLMQGTGSSQADSDEFGKQDITWILEKLEPSDDQAEYMRTVGADLLLDPFHLASITDNHPLFTAAMMSLKQHNLIVDLGLDLDAVARFLLKVEDGYHDVPYHNRTHAADVVSRLSSMLLVDDCIGSDGSIASKCSVYAAILAAAIHDYHHPGTDNNFQVASNTEVARRWNHHAVLENDSLYECLEMLRFPATDALKGTKGNRHAIISSMIKMVLGTDMVHHFSIVQGDFNTKVLALLRASKTKEHGKGSFSGMGASISPVARREWFKSLDDSTKTLVLTVAMKVADIGHTFTTWEAHLEWSKRLQDEFFIQGHMELKLGRKPGMLKDPNEPGVMCPSNQLGFTDVIATPLLKSWAEVFPVSGGILLEQCLSNRAKWWQKSEDGNNAKQRNSIDIQVDTGS